MADKSNAEQTATKEYKDQQTGGKVAEPVPVDKNTPQPKPGGPEHKAPPDASRK